MADDQYALKYMEDFKVIEIKLTEKGLRKAALAKVNNCCLTLDTPISPEMWHKDVHDEIVKLISSGQAAPDPQ